MDSVKNANGKIPLPSWQKEHGELSAKVRELDGRFQTLKIKVTQVDKFRVPVLPAESVTMKQRNCHKTA